MTNRLKLAAAGIGTAAVVAIGALGVAFTPGERRHADVW